MFPRPPGFPGFISLVLWLAAASARAALSDSVPELNDLQRWSVFSLGSTIKPDQFSNNSFIQGDVGAAGFGNVSLSDHARIEGNVYYQRIGTLKMDTGASMGGTEIAVQDSLLDDDIADAIAASNQAAALTRTFFAPSDIVLNRSRNFTVTGAPGADVVLNLGSFVLGGNSTFSLQGTATTTFIINVSKQFALSGNAAIVLSGGVQWDNVLFNVTGRGSNVSLSRNSSLTGILMATGRTVQLSGQASVAGEVIADRVVVTGSGTITHPPIVSP
jgi:cytoskeletal protein CcmA (bactofilin family)